MWLMQVMKINTTKTENKRDIKTLCREKSNHPNRSNHDVIIIIVCVQFFFSSNKKDKERVSDGDGGVVVLLSEEWKVSPRAEGGEKERKPICGSETETK
jgi:hypothetical protein